MAGNLIKIYTRKNLPGRGLVWAKVNWGTKS